MREPTYLGRIRELADTAVKEKGMELVHVAVAGSVQNPTIRIYIDKPGGVALDDCAAISQAMDQDLDADDFIPTAYTLEVSSPGIERGLYSISDFERFKGHKVKVRLKKALEGQRNFVGVIKEIRESEITLGDEPNDDIKFDYDQVAAANLSVDLDKELRSR